MQRALVEQHCTPQCKTSTALSLQQCQELLTGDWALDQHTQSISKDFVFKDFHQTMAFVNALAWIAHNEDHHPRLTVEYRSCRVMFTTHVIDGLTMNDFISAAKVDRLVE